MVALLVALVLSRGLMTLLFRRGGVREGESVNWAAWRMAWKSTLAIILLSAALGLLTGLPPSHDAAYAFGMVVAFSPLILLNCFLGGRRIAQQPPVQGTHEAQSEHHKFPWS